MTRNLHRIIVGAMLAWCELAFGNAPTVVLDRRGSAGAECENPLSLGVSDALDVALPAARAAWFRLQLPEAGNYVVTARADDASPRVELFAGCGERLIGPEPATSDSVSYVLVEADHDGQIFWLRASYAKGESTLQVSAGTVFVLTGFVTDELTGLPAQYVDVAAFTVSGLQQANGSVRTDANGYYQLGINVNEAAQGYYVRTGEQYEPRFLHEVHSDGTCLNHSVMTLAGCSGGVPLLEPGMPAPVRVNFSLGTGGMLEGRVLDDVTGLPIPGASIDVFLADPIRFHQRVSSDGGGRYRVRGLPTGNVLITVNRYDYQGELHDGLPCAWDGCSLLGGTPIPVSAGLTSYLDVRLQPSSYIDVTLTTDGDPVSNGSVGFLVAGADGSEAHFRGSGTPLGPLPAGTYFVQAFGYFFSEVYDGVTCDSLCTADEMRASGTPVVISGPGDRPRIAIDTQSLPTLRGRVVDTGGAPVSGALVSTSAFSYWSQPVRSDADGFYVMRDVFPGSHYVRAQVPEYIDQLFPGIDCESETPLASCAGAQQLTFDRSSGDQTADFTVRQSPRLHGTLHSGGLPLPAAWGWYRAVELRKPDGTVVTGTTLRIDDLTSSYTLSDIPPGSYYVIARVGGYFSQIADGINCPYHAWDFTCPLTGAMLHAVGIADAQLNFDLVPWGQEVRVLSEDDVPIPSVVIDLWDDDGFSLGAGSTGLDGRLLLTRSDIPHAYLSTDNAGGFLDEVFDDRPCARGTSVYRGGCSLNGAFPVPLPNPDASTPPIIIRLAPDPTIFRDQF